jgi:cyclophilin family peptidyl-prolyl cis-trans isomerase
MPAMFARTRRSLSRPAHLRAVDSPRRIAGLVQRAGSGQPPVLEQLEERRLLASVLVVSNATLIEDGETLAREFGYEQLGESARSHEFVIANVGADPFDLSDLQVPAGYRITQDIADTTIESGGTTTFRVSLDPNSTAGEKSGDILFLASDNDGTTTFNFAVEGTLTSAGGPRVVGFAPDITGGFWADFDEALDADSVGTDSVRSYTAGPDGELNTEDDQLITGTVDYLADRRQIRFIPDDAVTADYRVELLGSGANVVTALGGEIIDGEYFAGLPSGNGTPGGSFQARVDVSNRTDVARFDTVLGVIDVLLTPDVTPITVDNFYSYADDGDWDMSFMHRSVASFIIQGGGYFFDNGVVGEIDSHGKIQNEYQQGVTTNTRGTIAMAKLGGQPNSATNEWFFNLADNSDNLDSQNGGFTTFGTITSAAGLEVMDHIASLDTVNAGGDNPDSPFKTLPLRDLEAVIDNDNLVVMNRISSLVDYEPLVQGSVWEVVLEDGNETPVDAVDFGNLAAGAFADQDLLILNRGTETVTITVADGLAAPFTITPTNGAGDQDDWVLEPGGFMSVTITYSPTASGIYSDQLTISAPGSDPTSFTIDLDGTALPDRPNSVNLNPASDTGLSNTDDLTKLNNSSQASRLGFLVSGVEAGATVTLYANDVVIGSAVVPDGSDSLTVVTDGVTVLLDGTFSITAVQTRDGADSLASPPLTLTVDTAAPTLSGADDASVTQGSPFTTDLGSDDEDAELDPVYALTVGPDDATINADTGVVSWSPIGTDVGENDFTVTVTDVAGNTTTSDFVVTVLPLAPATADLASAADTGTSNLDNITNRNNNGDLKVMAFRVDEVIEGAAVRIYAGATLVAEGVVPAGADSIFLVSNGTAALADGVYQIVATQSIHGFTSNGSTALSIEVDATGPILESVDSFSHSAGQPLSVNLETDDEDNGASVVYSLVSAPAGATVNPETGVISWTPLDSQIGTQHFVTSATDVAGNVAQEEFDVEVMSTILDEGGLTFNSNLSGKGSEQRFLVQPTLTGAFLVTMDDVDPAAKIDIYNQATGVKIAKPGKTNAGKGLAATTVFEGTAGVTYEVVVKPKGNVSGDFTLDVAYDPDGRAQDAVVIPEELVDLGDEGTALRFEASGTIDELLDRDFLTFTPTTGGDAAFAFTAADGLEGEMVVYTLSGGTLTKVKKLTDKTGSGVGFTTTLTAGVQYVVQIASSKGRSIGSYDIVVEVDSNSSIASPAPLGEFTDAMSISGELLHKQDDDWFSFTPTASGALLYDMTAEAGMKMKLTFVDAATGARLSQSSGKAGSLPYGRFEVTAGREVRVLAEAKGNSSGDYTINLEMDDLGAAASAAPLVLTETTMGSELDGMLAAVDGEISSNLDRDFYSFTAPAGFDSGLFTVSATSGDLVANVTLYANEGGTLRQVRKAKAKAGSAQIRADLSAGTEYFFVVESLGGKSTGDYSLAVELDGNNALANADSLGEIGADATTVTGEILDKGDVDVFQFTASADGVLTLDNFVGGGTVRPKITVYSAAGDKLASKSGTTDSLDALTVEVVAGQTYYLEIVTKGNNPGTYSLDLQLG